MFIMNYIKNKLWIVILGLVALSKTLFIWNRYQARKIRKQDKEKRDLALEYEKDSFLERDLHLKNQSYIKHQERAVWLRRQQDLSDDLYKNGEGLPPYIDEVDGNNGNTSDNKEASHDETNINSSNVTI